MALQMTTTMGMEVDTRSSTAEATMEMGRATTTLGEQQQLQLLHLAKLHNALQVSFLLAMPIR